MKINKEQITNFSNFIREATRERLIKIKKEKPNSKVNRKLIEQGRDTAKLDIKLCDDFKYIDEVDII